MSSPNNNFNKLIRIVHVVSSIYGLDRWRTGIETTLIQYLMKDPRRALLAYEKIRDIIMEK